MKQFSSAQLPTSSLYLYSNNVFRTTVNGKSEILTCVPRWSSWRANGKMPRMTSMPLLSTKMKALLWGGPFNRCSQSSNVSYSHGRTAIHHWSIVTKMFYQSKPHTAGIKEAMPLPSRVPQRNLHQDRMKPVSDFLQLQTVLWVSISALTLLVG